MANSVFCLDIGEKYIKAADVEKTKNGLVAHSATYSTYDSNPYINGNDDVLKAASTFVAKLITDAKFQKREVNIVVPDNQSYTRIIEMPLLTDKELISAVKYQADQFIPIPIEKVNIDIHSLVKDKKNNKSRILIVAAPKTLIETVTNIAEGAALLPQSIENESSATLRLLSTMDEMLNTKSQQEGTDIYISFGYTSSTVYLYDKVELIPLQIHNFPIGVDIFKRDLKASFNVQDEQIDELFEKGGFEMQNGNYDLNQLLASPLNEFVSEIRRFLISSKSVVKGKIENVHIFGEGAKIKGLDVKLTSLLGSQVTVFSPLQVLVKNQVSDYFANDWQMLLPTVGGSLR